MLGIMLTSDSYHIVYQEQAKISYVKLKCTRHGCHSVGMPPGKFQVLIAGA